MTEENWNNVVELFNKKFPEYKNTPGSVLEMIQEFNSFNAFRLGYYLGGTDALEEFAAKVKEKNTMCGG